MSKKLKFIDVSQSINQAFYPKPASHFIPEWYKQMPGYSNGKKVVPDPVNGDTHRTVKKCMPVFDSLTAGYIIPFPADIDISNQEEDGQGIKWFAWTNQQRVGFHPPVQTGDYPRTKRSEIDPTAKFLSPWGFITPPGYSLLFTTPVHRDVPFHIMEGIVDTDTYHSEIHLPMFFKDPDWEGMLEAGTPMVQVIPFKRQSWEMEVVTDNDSRAETAKSDSLINSVFANGYKDFLWSRKSFK